MTIFASLVPPMAHLQTPKRSTTKNHPDPFSECKNPQTPPPSSSPPTKLQYLQNKLHKMLGKKLGSVKKLAKKVSFKSFGNNNEVSNYEYLLSDSDEGSCGRSASTATPTGTFPVYVGEGRRRFVVPTSYLSHPLFKIMLEKAYDEFGFHQRSGLVIPCSVTAFQEVINAVECSNIRFDFGELVKEFV